MRITSKQTREELILFFSKEIKTKNCVEKNTLKFGLLMQQFKQSNIISKIKQITYKKCINRLKKIQKYSKSITALFKPIILCLGLIINQSMIKIKTRQKFHKWLAFHRLHNHKINSNQMTNHQKIQCKVNEKWLAFSISKTSNSKVLKKDKN